MKKIKIYTNKDINNLLRDNGHDYRLMKLCEYNEDDIIELVTIDEYLDINLDVVYIVDIPGLSFKKYNEIFKKLHIKNKIVFIQDSFFRYSVNKFITYIKYQYTLRDILKSLYHLLYAFVNELLISIYFKKVGYVSKDDFFLPVLFKNKYFVVKNGVESFDFENESKKIDRNHIRLFFWGNMMYGPNRDSLLIFIRNFWPDLQKEFINIELHVYGKYDQSLLSLVEDCNINNIYFEGRFDTLESLFKDNDIFVNFVQYGAGIKNKTLEALAYKIPMICSPHSLEGIEEIDNYKYIYSNVNELIEAIDLIADNFDLKNSIKNCKIVKEMYTWKNAYQNYIQGVVL